MAKPRTPPVVDQTADLILHATIAPDPLNPRTTFDDAAIAELAASIRTDGLLQPLLVRPLAPLEGHTQPMHRLVAGERRWRAIGLLIAAGAWPEDRPIPVTVRDMSDETHLRLALIENLKRRDLNPVEEARAFIRLQDEFKLTTKAIGDLIGFSQRHVQKRLALLELDAKILARLETGEIDIAAAQREQANLPKPFNLPPEDALLLLELAHRSLNTGDRPQAERRASGVTLKVHYTAAADERFARLSKAWVTHAWQDYTSGRQLLQVHYSGKRALAEVLAVAPSVIDGPGDALLELVEAALAAARAAAGTTSGEGYATEWLNLEPEIDPEVAADKARQKAEEEKRDAEHKAKAKAEKDARAANATAFRAVAKAVKSVATAPVTPDFVATVETTGILLPVSVKSDKLVDAAGKTVLESAHRYTSRNYATAEAIDALRLLALALNAASGFARSAVPEGEAAEPAVAEDEDEDESYAQDDFDPHADDAEEAAA